MTNSTPTTAERLRALIAKAERDPFADSQLEDVLKAGKLEIAAVLSPRSFDEERRVSLVCRECWFPDHEPGDGCAIGALDRAIAAALGEDEK